MNGSPDMMVAGLKMVTALGVVLAVLFALLYGMKKFAGRRIGAIKGNRIQLIENQYIGVKKSISLVRVPGKILVLGITPERIQLLDTLSDDDEFQQCEAVETAPFGSILLDRLKKSKNGTKKEEIA
jgi:flagellar protein FliO/FliZ